MDIGGAPTGSVIRGFDKIRQVGEGLTDATVRLGPFTTSVRKAVGGLALFSPILVDVVGAVGALVGVTGSAVVGVGALGAAVAGGAAPALLGMGLVVRNVAQEFQAVQKAQKSYNDTVLKDGKNSDQAAKKLDQLRHVMSGVSEETAKQVLSARDLNKECSRAPLPAAPRCGRPLGRRSRPARA